MVRESGKPLNVSQPGDLRKERGTVWKLNRDWIGIFPME